MYNRFTRFSYAIADISRNWHKLAGEEMEKHGLKSAHSMYLLALADSEEGLTAPQLCEVCGKDKADVSRMTRILEDRGIITKDRIFQSRYGGVFRLTEEGRSIAQQIRVRAAKAVELAGADLTEEHREIFYTALESIAANLQRMTREGMD